MNISGDALFKIAINNVIHESMGKEGSYAGMSPEKIEGIIMDLIRDQGYPTNTLTHNQKDIIKGKALSISKERKNEI